MDPLKQPIELIDLLEHEPDQIGIYGFVPIIHVNHIDDHIDRYPAFLYWSDHSLPLNTCPSRQEYETITKSLDGVTKRTPTTSENIHSRFAIIHENQFTNFQGHKADRRVKLPLMVAIPAPRDPRRDIMEMEELEPFRLFAEYNIISTELIHCKDQEAKNQAIGYKEENIRSIIEFLKSRQDDQLSNNLDDLLNDKQMLLEATAEYGNAPLSQVMDKPNWKTQMTAKVTLLGKIQFKRMHNLIIGNKVVELTERYAESKDHSRMNNFCYQINPRHNLEQNWNKIHVYAKTPRNTTKKNLYEMVIQARIDRAKGLRNEKLKKGVASREVIIKDIYRDQENLAWQTNNTIWFVRGEKMKDITIASSTTWK